MNTVRLSKSPPEIIDRIHLSIGGAVSLPFFDERVNVTATYFSGDMQFGRMSIGKTYALGLCSPWFEGEEGPSELEDVAVSADWPVNFGRARKLESRMLKALEQAQAPEGNVVTLGDLREARSDGGA